MQSLSSPAPYTALVLLSLEISQVNWKLWFGIHHILPSLSGRMSASIFMPEIAEKEPQEISRR